jgi:hypothetical protein
MRSITSRSSTGLRRPNRGLNRRLDRRLNRYTAVMCRDVPRPRARDDLPEALRCFREYFRWRKRFAKLMPGFFDYAAHDRRVREEAERRQLEMELNAAMGKIYGPLADRMNPAAGRLAGL